MTEKKTSRRSRSAIAISFAVSVAFPALCAGQTPAPATAPTAPTAPPPAPTVFSNPRASSDDPRIGLKGGLYDAGEAAFGMQRLATLPKPPGFAPGEPNTTPPPPDPPAEPGAAAGGRGNRPPSIQYGA